MLKGFLLSLLVLISLKAFGDDRLKIEGVKIEEQNGKTVTTFMLANAPKNTPEIFVRGNILQYSFKNAYIWPRIEKQVMVGGQKIQIMAYQFDKDTVRVRTIYQNNFPENIQNQISFGPLAKNLTVEFSETKKIVEAGTSETKKTAENFDEKYLDEITKENEKSGFATNTGVAGTGTKNIFLDKIKTKSSGAIRNNTFTFGTYILKFSAFLALVLVLFYGVVTLFKKGFVGKGKLGLLNIKEGVVVLNTTYLAPKRSLMLIKAHNQVFLLANTETGINLVSEIQNVSSLLKNGEKETSGNNFDSTLDESDRRDVQFKMKNYVGAQAAPIRQVEEENRTASTADKSSLSSFLDENPVKDEVKVSDKIKNRVKSLRSFQ